MSLDNPAVDPQRPPPAYRPLRRNAQQKATATACCKACEHYVDSRCCMYFPKRRLHRARKRLAKVIANANVWCPVWIDKLGLIGTESDATEHVDAFLASETSRQPPPATLHGRGIVIVGGGPKYLPGVYVNVRLLRSLGCALPIEIWHVGSDEMPDAWSERLTRYIGNDSAIRDARLVAERLDQSGVVARASAQMPLADTLYGWETKGLALQWSAFEEAILLDSDCYPTRDPSEVFDWPEYREHGACFWPDRHGQRSWCAVKRDTWRAFGIPESEYRNEWEHETGQVVVDKRRSWDCLTLANWYLQNGRNFYFHYQLGDKDVFHMAWRKLRRGFALVPHEPEINSARPQCLMHRDFAGTRLFQHRTAAKFRLPMGKNRRLPDFVHEDRCFAFLSDLAAETARP